MICTVQKCFEMDNQKNIDKALHGKKFVQQVRCEDVVACVEVAQKMGRSCGNFSKTCRICRGGHTSSVMQIVRSRQARFGVICIWRCRQKRTHMVFGIGNVWREFVDENSLDEAQEQFDVLREPHYLQSVSGETKFCRIRKKLSSQKLTCA